MGLLREAVEAARHAGAVIDRSPEEAGARRARSDGRWQRIQCRAAEGSRPAGRAGISDRGHADDLRTDRHIRERTASQCGAAVPGLAAHAGNPAVLHRLLGTVFGSRAGAIEAGPPQDLRHQADEGRPSRGGENDGRDQDPLRAAVSGLNVLAARLTTVVIPGWSEGPDHRCAIAHRGISRFRVRSFYSRPGMPGRQFIRALVTASSVTPPFLGAVAWELLAAPNSGLLNQLYRFAAGGDAGEHLFNIYSMTGIIFVISCYTFPFVFVLVANALDNMPGELEDASAILGGRAWTTARRVTIPLALPALVAGALIAFLQAMTLFGSPAILALPAGFHTMTTKIWSLFQYPPKLELAAAAAVPLLLLTIVLLQAQKFILGRRGYSVVGGKYGAPRRVEMKKWRWAALAFCLVVLLNPVFLPYFALFNAAFSPNATTLVTPATLTLHNIVFVFTELSSTKLALKNTVILGASTATIGTILALVIAYVTTRRVIAGHRILGFLATAPVAVPGIVLGVGLFLSYTRPPFVLYGTLWILLIPFLTINLPSAYH